MSIGMASMKKFFDTAIEVKRRHDGINFMLATIEFELREVISSPQFHKLTEKEQKQIVIPFAKALKFWRVQIDDFIDRNIAALVNTANKSTSKELEITLEEAIAQYRVPHEEFLASPEDSRRASTAIATVKEVVVETPEKEVEEEEEEISDDDILEQLMAGQT